MLAILKAKVREHPTYTAAIVAVSGWLIWAPLRAALPWGIGTRIVLMIVLAVSLLATIRVGHDVLMWLAEAAKALEEKRERERNPELFAEKERAKAIQDALTLPMSEIASRYPAVIEYMRQRPHTYKPEDELAAILEASQMLATIERTSVKQLPH